MKTELMEEALEFGAVLERALRREGGVDLVRAAEAGSPGQVGHTLAEFGLWDLRPIESDSDGEAAAAACRAAGRVGLPYPVAERLAAQSGSGYDAIALVGKRPRVNQALVDSAMRWGASNGNGSVAPVTSVGPPLGTKLGSMVSEVSLGPWSTAEHDVDALVITLQCWTLLGMLDSALDMTRTHLLTRSQFGKPLAAFQALQFRFADTATIRQGLEELAKYTLWSVLAERPGAMVDALSCRMVAIEVADDVFKTAHQMHGAIGFCDELDLSWLSRHSQPLRRLPWGRSQTKHRLLDAMHTAPFEGLYGAGLVELADV